MRRIRKILSIIIASTMIMSYGMIVNAGGGASNHTTSVNAGKTVSIQTVSCSNSSANHYTLEVDSVGFVGLPANVWPSGNLRFSITSGGSDKVTAYFTSVGTRTGTFTTSGTTATFKLTNNTSCNVTAGVSYKIT